ncbi:hypothetical protein D3C87_2116060 [compost metagenome]
MPVIWRPKAPSVAMAADGAASAANVIQGAIALRQRVRRAQFDLIASPFLMPQGANSALGSFHVPFRTSGFGP